ncbi:MAG: ribosome small subunit-dependent GTPase A [Synechococcaceae cyanobacterium]|nr:ribosome small subunit-dependent GTPase A [Synechococcaceae cyanobacterium]
MAGSGVEPPGPDGGLVVAIEANFCRVELDQPGPGGATRLLCTRRSRLAKTGLAIAVGDRVRVDGVDWASARAVVDSVAPRRNQLLRPAVANVDRVVVVVSLADPAPEPLQLSRFLIAAEALGGAVELVFSKADLVDAATHQAWSDRVSAWGYRAVTLSSRAGDGLAELRQRLQQPGLSVLCGPSGVGKSSLLNALRPSLDLRVGAVSGRLRRGRHTTRHVELFPLGPSALVADSPGFNQPLLPLTSVSLPQLFPELRRQLQAAPCRFADCRHLDDPGCVVSEDWERREIYARCLAEQDSLAIASGREPRPRGRGVRQRGSGDEPLLDPALRRQSRRRQRQGLLVEQDGAEAELS